LPPRQPHLSRHTIHPKLYLNNIAATLQNSSLSQVLQSDRIFTVERTIELLVALLRLRLNSPEIHGQITPDRILISSQKPIDLQILPADRLRVDPEFSAPEIFDGKISPSSDLYSIGLITIYLLTGIRPFQLFDMANHCWVWQDYWQIPIQASRINYPKLAAILDQSIDLDPNLRFSSAREMMTAVRDCVPNLAPMPPNWACQHTLTGHQGLFAAIKTIAISPQLPLVATGSEDQTIRLWNINTGAEIGILTGHQKSVETIAFHPHQSGRLFSGDRSGQIKLWQVDPAEELISIDSQQDKVNCLAISPDGKLIISGGSDKTIKIWYFGLSDERSIDYLATLKAHQLAVNGIAFNPIEGEVKFASVSSDRRVMLWGIESKTPLSILSNHTQSVKTLAFSPDGKFLATAGDDGLIQLWDLDNRKLARTISAHRWTISSLSFLADGVTLISASWDENVKFWNVKSGEEIDCLSTHLAEILGMEICDNRQCIVTASRDRTAKIWQRVSIERK
jgi:WD40 repeat protein